MLNFGVYFSSRCCFKSLHLGTCYYSKVKCRYRYTFGKSLEVGSSRELAVSYNQDEVMANMQKRLLSDLRAGDSLLNKQTPVLPSVLL